MCLGAEHAKTIVQTLSRPRAHRAVGRWPPVSRAGRRVEKNVFPRSAGVKRPEGAKVKETCRKRCFRSLWQEVNRCTKNHRQSTGEGRRIWYKDTMRFFPWY